MKRTSESKTAGSDAFAGAQASPTGKEWFAVHTYSGFEQKVKDSLIQRAEIQNLTDKVGEVIVPIESVVEMRAGKKVVTPKKSMPGYIFVELEWSTDTYYLVKQTAKVTGFVGISTNKQGLPLKPPVVPREEVERIINRVEESKEEPKPKFTFEKGESVR